MRFASPRSLLATASLIALACVISIGCGDDDELGVGPGGSGWLTPPDAFNVVARTTDELVLGWRPSVRDADGYELERLREADGQRDTISVPGARTSRYTDQGLGERGSYTYRARTRQGEGRSAWTRSVAARTLPVPPDSVQADALDRNRIQVRWSMPLPDPSGFEIERRGAGESWSWLVTVPGSERSFLDARLEFGNSYEYRLRAFDDGDSSEWTGTVATENDQYSSGPRGLTERLAAAFEQRDAGLYASILSYDFLFRFSEHDRYGHPDWVRQWSRTAESTAFSALCADERIEWFSVRFTPRAAEIPDPSSNAPPGTWLLRLTDFTLDLRTRDEFSQLHDFDVVRGSQWLFIRPPSSDPGGPGPWTIVEWRELLDLVPAETWGEVKDYYHSAAEPEIVFTLPEVEGSVPPQGPHGCGTFLQNADGTYERAYAWGGAGVAGPQGGAFAECYSSGPSVVCSVTFDLTQDGTYRDQTLDFFVWDDADGVPGSVLFLRRGVNPGAIAEWPDVSRHVIAFASPDLQNDWWIGCMGNWRGEPPGWFIAADTDGFGGCPSTYATSASGYSVGWHPVPEIFGTTMALGIGAEVNPIAPE